MNVCTRMCIHAEGSCKWLCKADHKIQPGKEENFEIKKKYKACSLLVVPYMHFKIKQE